MKKSKSNNTDKSHILHLLFWTIFGIIFPKKYIYAFILSILWEIFEVLLVNVPFFYKLTKRYWKLPEKYWNEKYTNKLLDIILNMSGYFIGSNLY